MACTLIALYKIFEEYPIIIAANRDEDKNRGGKEPQRIDTFKIDGIEISTGGKVVAPLDGKKGGTWTGFNDKDGLVVGVTNLISGDSGEGYTSRGKLVSSSLAMGNAEVVRGYINSEVSERKYKNFNLFFADRTSAFVAYYENGSLSSKEIGEGVHVLTHGEIDNKDDAKIANTLKLIEGSGIKNNGLSIEDTIKKLIDICGYHNEFEPQKSICIHSDYGTLSSTIIAVHKQLMKSIIRHSNGNPCSHEYKDYSHLIAQNNFSYTLF